MNKNFTKEAKRIAVTLIITYVLFLLLVVFIQRDLTYFPKDFKPDPAQYGFTDVDVITATTSDGLDLEAWYWPPRTERDSVVLMFHGNNSDMGMSAQHLAELREHGYGLLLAEYRGYALNPGKPSEVGLYSDSRAYRNWLNAHGIEDRRIVIFGQSIGTGVAVNLATEIDEKALVLEAPYTSIVDIGKQAYVILPAHGLLHDVYDSKSKIAYVHSPVLIVTGDKDGVIPMENSQKLFDAAVEPKALIMMPGASHYTYKQHGLLEEMHKFLQKIDSASGASHNN